MLKVTLPAFAPPPIVTPPLPLITPLILRGDANEPRVKVSPLIKEMLGLIPSVTLALPPVVIVLVDPMKLKALPARETVCPLFVAEVVKFRVVN